MSNPFLNILLLCVALASAETLHGIFRAAILVPRTGKKIALKISIFTGSILAFLVCYYFVPRMGYNDVFSLIMVGIVISSFMAFFDIALSMFLLKRSFKKSLNDFNPKTGNYLLFGILLLSLYPTIVMQIID